MSDSPETIATPLSWRERWANTPPAPIRAVARLIDLLVQIAIMESAGRLSKVLPETRLIAVGDDTLFWIDVSVGLTAMVVYTALSEWWGGATFGKFCCALRVVRAEGGGPVSLRSAFVRSAAFLLDGFALGLVAHSSMIRSTRNQRVGDHWAKTVVVWKWQAEERRGLGWPAAAPIALGFVLLSYLLA